MLCHCCPQCICSDVLQYLDDVKSGHRTPPPPPTEQATIGKTLPVQPAIHPPSTSRPTPVPVVKVDSKGSQVNSREVSYIDIPVDELQKSVAQQMVQSKTTIPHTYASVSCNVQRLIEITRTLEDGSGEC